MYTIWKYEIPTETNFEIEMPRVSKVLKCENQRNLPYMWVLVDTESTLIKRKFLFVGTGHKLDIGGLGDVRHVSTFQVDGGNYIFHIFEV